MSIPQHAPVRHVSGPRMPAVRNGIGVLRALARSTTPISAGALARSLHIPRSTTYQLLQVLVEEDLVVHLPEAAAYTLGQGLFELGNGYERRSLLEHLAHPLLARLSQTANVSATLGVLDGHEVVYLARQHSRHRVPLMSEPGVHLPAHLTTSGRAMLSRLPRREVLALYPSAEVFSALGTAGTGPGSLRELREVLAQDVQRGWSQGDDGLTDGTSYVAAAVIDRLERPVAAIAAAFPTRRTTQSLAQIAREVTRAADRLTRQLGGMTPRRTEAAKHTTRSTPATLELTQE